MRQLRKIAVSCFICVKNLPSGGIHLETGAGAVEQPNSPISVVQIILVHQLDPRKAYHRPQGQPGIRSISLGTDIPF